MTKHLTYYKIFCVILLGLTISLNSFGLDINRSDINNNDHKANGINKLSNKDFCRFILRKYEEKDLASFDQMFADNVVIRDWKIRTEGKALALNEFKKNFESVNTIKIDILSMYENDNAVAAELKITLDEKQVIYIVDVITLTQDQKIASIRSYIGRGDEEEQEN